MNIQNGQFLSIEQLTDTYLSGNKKSQPINSTVTESFQEILEQKSNRYVQLKFSKHAANRLNTRNIELTENQVERLKDGMQKANEKGIKDSLVLMDELAFIVNVPSNTVVTAMDQTQNAEQIFTNIDGAVIA